MNERKCKIDRIVLLAVNFNENKFELRIEKSSDSDMLTCKTLLTCKTSQIFSSFHDSLCILATKYLNELVS